MHYNDEKSSDFYVELKTVTWNKDSHGLFDYENKNLQISKNYIFKSSEIFRKDYYIDPTSHSLEESLSSKNEETFLVIRSFKDKDGQAKGYPIEPGNLIKLGRVEYAIIESRSYNFEIKTFQKNFFCSEDQYIYDSNSFKQNNETKICRICLEESLPISPNSEINNLLIKPCKCKGSCKYVHISCLQNWFSSKHIKKTIGNTTYYCYKRLECEVCKETLPKSIIYNGKSIDLINIDKPLRPYLILESLSREKQSSRGLFLIEILPGEQIKIGRGHQCDLRITDISVSRLHAIIKYENNQFRIFDNSSKFGTLLLLNYPLQINNEKMAIQIGRTVITLVCKNETLKDKINNFVENLDKEVEVEEKINKNLYKILIYLFRKSKSMKNLIQINENNNSANENPTEIDFNKKYME